MVQTSLNVFSLLCCNVLNKCNSCSTFITFNKMRCASVSLFRRNKCWMKEAAHCTEIPLSTRVLRMQLKSKSDRPMNEDDQQTFTHFNWAPVIVIEPPGWSKDFCQRIWELCNSSDVSYFTNPDTMVNSNKEEQGCQWWKRCLEVPVIGSEKSSHDPVLRFTPLLQFSDRPSL